MLKKGIIRLEDSFKRANDVIGSIKAGMIFIYPTDTIYGLGCDATNDKSVRILRKIKKRYTKPLSIIAPSTQWILKNCYVRKKFLIYISRLPGPFTFLLRLKRKSVISSEVTDTDILGVRIPAHDFTRIIQQAAVPFITTSVNVSGKIHANSIKEVPWQIRRHCIAIDAGRIEGKPSTIFDLTGEKAKIIRR
jgi:L-threonylcarbamoyladenylate synthase